MTCAEGAIFSDKSSAQTPPHGSAVSACQLEGLVGTASVAAMHSMEHQPDETYRPSQRASAAV